MPLVLVVHAAAQTDGGFLIFDVFESQAAFDRFSQAIRPIVQAVGIEEPPTAYCAHTFISV
jgi:hypothetical protein